MTEPLSAADRLRVEAALDGELDASHALAFERDLAVNPDLRALYERHAAVREAVQASVAPERAPASLRLKIDALARPPAPRRWSSRGPLAMAASLVFGVAIGALAVGVGFRETDPRLGGLVAGYMRGSVSGQPFDVASSDRHTVKPWLTAHVPFGAEVIDLAPQGFTLIGGRVDIVDGRAAPTLIYKRREHVIALSELPLALAGRDGPTSAEGYQIERWRDAERAYVAISDVDASDLAVFAAAFRTAGKGAEK